MFDWLIDGLKFGLGSVDRLVTVLRNALATLWSLLVSFFTEQMQAAGYVSDQGAALASTSLSLALAIVKLTMFLIFIALPRLGASVLSQMTDWALQKLAELRADLDAAIHEAEHLASLGIGDVRSGLDALGSDFRNAIRDINALLSFVVGKVNELLTDPSALARWLLVPLWHVAMGFVQDNAVALSRWALGMAVNGVLKAAGVLEDIIVQIF